MSSQVSTFPDFPAINQSGSGIKLVQHNTEQVISIRAPTREVTVTLPKGSVSHWKVSTRTVGDYTPCVYFFSLYLFSCFCPAVFCNSELLQTLLSSGQDTLDVEAKISD